MHLKSAAEDIWGAALLSVIFSNLVNTTTPIFYLAPFAKAISRRSKL